MTKRKRKRFGETEERKEEIGVNYENIPRLMYKRREKDELGENLLVFCPNNVYDLQTALCLIHSQVYIIGIWAILEHSALLPFSTSFL